MYIYPKQIAAIIYINRKADRRPLFPNHYNKEKIKWKRDSFRLSQKSCST